MKYKLKVSEILIIKTYKLHKNFTFHLVPVI